MGSRAPRPAKMEMQSILFADVYSYICRGEQFIGREGQKHWVFRDHAGYEQIPLERTFQTASIGHGKMGHDKAMSTGFLLGQQPNLRNFNPEHHNIERLIWPWNAARSTSSETEEYL